MEYNIAKLNALPLGLSSLCKRMLEQICNSDNADLYKRMLVSIAIVTGSGDSDATKVVSGLSDRLYDSENVV